MKIKHQQQPARYIVERLGGCRKVARMLDIHPSTISRWMTPVINRGTGGRIPQKYWAQIMAHSKATGIDIATSDLFAA
ncbi:carph-isopro domain-containing protein [Pseudomonas sp.]|uniref:carph-isopro domain-containing protein n=1 Tax=Pseudomonas sp. TaxID=306 RepID=UPI00258A1558|nr:hypothetical protein [Pseudomonas sp.]